MKAISVRQPWAWALAQGYKDIENRTWDTSYRGQLIIHAAQARTHYEQDAYWIREEFGLKVPPIHKAKFGGVVGVASLVDVVTSHESDWFEGPFGFVFDEPRTVRFIECKGALSIWTPSDEIVQQITKRKR